MAGCSKCRRREAIYLRKYSGEKLCPACFIHSVEREVKETISKYKLLEPNDRIALALSGGKDSLTLLHILHKIEQKFPKAEIIAVTVDEGVGGYREQGLENSCRHCKLLGVEHVVASFKNYYGDTLEEIYRKVKEDFAELNACSYCGVLRRRLLNIKAKELKADKVATAHNLDDEAQTILMNILRGDLARLARLSPMPERLHPGFIPRIKPMRYIPEREVGLYAYLKGFDFYERMCPYIHESMRHEVREMINKIEAKHSGATHVIVRTFDKLSPTLTELIAKGITIKSCRLCDEPTTGEICRACELLEKVKG